MFKPSPWWIAYLAWGLMMYALFTGALEPKGGILRSPEELLESIELTEESSWMSVYLKGAKLGYVNSKITPRPDGGYDILEFSRIDGAMMGTQQSMIIQMNVVTDSALALQSFEGSVNADPYNTEFKGALDDKVLWVLVGSGENAQRRFIPAPEPIYLSQTIKPMVQTGKLGAGDSLKLAGFDPIQLTMQDMIVLGAPVLEHEVLGRKITARKLVTRLKGFESYIYVDEEGETLAEQGPLGLTMIKDDMESALDMQSDKGKIDFLNVYAVLPKGTIHNPRQTRRVKMKLTSDGIDAVAKTLSEIGTLTDLTEHTKLFEHSVDPAPATEEDLVNITDFLEPGAFIESDDPAIILAAVAAVKGGNDRLDTLRRLSAWVFDYVEKKPSAGLPSASEVLKNRSGDCNEHTSLFTAMARSLNIPSRMVLGIVYQEGRFYYHAWPASLTENGWVEFEPTFGLDQADAARVPLAVGDLSKSVDLIGLIGNLEIEIVDYD